MNDDSRKLDNERLSKLLEEMNQADREGLEARAKAGSKDLTLDEVGVLFLINREKIRAIERKARGE